MFFSVAPPMEAKHLNPALSAILRALELGLSASQKASFLR